MGTHERRSLSSTLPMNSCFVESILNSFDANLPTPILLCEFEFKPRENTDGLSLFREKMISAAQLGCNWPLSWLLLRRSFRCN